MIHRSISSHPWQLTQNVTQLKLRFEKRQEFHDRFRNDFFSGFSRFNWCLEGKRREFTIDCVSAFFAYQIKRILQCKFAKNPPISFWVKWFLNVNYEPKSSDNFECLNFFYLSLKQAALTSWRNLRNKTIKKILDSKAKKKIEVENWQLMRTAWNIFRNRNPLPIAENSLQRHKNKFIRSVKSAGKLKLNAFISWKFLVQYLSFVLFPLDILEIIGKFAWAWWILLVFLAAGRFFSRNEKNTERNKSE